MPLSKEQLEIRKTRVGSSEISAIVGVNPFKTPLDVYWSKVGPDEDRFQGNTSTEFGDSFEPVIAEMYAKRFNLKINKYTETLLHPTFNGVSATPDFDVCNVSGEVIKLLEVKNVGHHGMSYYGEEGTELYPDWHRCQMAWQLMVVDMGDCDLAAYFGGSDLRVYAYKRDREIERLLLSHLKESSTGRDEPGRYAELFEIKIQK